MNDLNSLIQKIMSDAEFRKELAASPAEALTKNGFEATEDLLKTFTGMDEAGLAELASNYSSDKAAC